jgi:hypothetical protein
MGITEPPLDIEMRIADNFDRVLNIVVAQSIGIGPPFKLPLDGQPTLM